MSKILVFGSMVLAASISYGQSQVIGLGSQSVTDQTARSAASSAQSVASSAQTTATAAQTTASSAQSTATAAQSTATTAQSSASAALTAAQSALPQTQFYTALGNGFFGAGGIPTTSIFVPPAPNACQSSYDQYYSTEPGVYDYWALCELSGTISDTVGNAQFTTNYGSGPITRGVASPVSDGEAAISYTSGTVGLSNQFVALNNNAGSIAAWINSAVTDAGDEVAFPVTTGSSRVALGVVNGGFRALFKNSAGTNAIVSKNGYTLATWHRVVMTWASGTLTLYVDGASVGSTTYTGSLDNQVAYFQMLFAGYSAGQTIQLAKVSLSNQAWSTAQVASDYAPVLPVPPTGGLLVTTQQLGKVHSDVLGFGDSTEDLSSTASISALQTGLRAAGVRGVRYGGGTGGGIQVDLTDWHPTATVQCTNTSGTTKAAVNVPANNNIDTFMANIAIPLGLHVTQTVNYGTNASTCDGPGDPTANAANLFTYLNVTKGYGIKRAEIGNELYAAGTSETDFHSGAYTGSGSSAVASGLTYAQYEPPFYNAIKQVDSTVQIAVPWAEGLYSWKQTWSLAGAGAGVLFDAVIFHDYPVVDPITDGATLYPERIASNLVKSRGNLLSIQTSLLNFGKDPSAIWITEWDEEVAGNKWSRQTLGIASPLFAAMQLGLYTTVGVQDAIWWNQGTSNYCNQYNYDYQGESSYSWLGQCGGTHLVYTLPGQIGDVDVGFKPGTLSPVGSVFSMISASGYITEGETSKQIYTDLVGAPWLAGYAATHGTGTAVMLINRDRDAAHVVPISIAGKTSGTGITTYEYGKSQYDTSAFNYWSLPYRKTTLGLWTGSPSIVLPPWSVTVAIIN